MRGVQRIQQISAMSRLLVRLGRQPLLPTVTGFHVLSWIRGPELVYDAALAGRRSLSLAEGVSPCNHSVDSTFLLSFFINFKALRNVIYPPTTRCDTRYVRGVTPYYGTHEY